MLVGNKLPFIKIGGDMVKTSAVRSIESEEANLADAPDYFIEATKNDNAGALPKPKTTGEKITRRFLMNGTETRDSARKLEKDLTDYIERDYEVLSKKVVQSEQGTTTAYQYGNMLEERTIKIKLENGVYCPVIVSIKRNGEEKL